MDHQDHVALIRNGVPPTGGVWADLGSGSGAFTLALAELIGPGGEIYSVDQDRDGLRQQARRMAERFAGVSVHYLIADFTGPLDLPPLDGILMANALHFVRDKEPVLRRIRDTLKSGGRFILVEYDTDQGNRWVPYPISFATWRELAERAGFDRTKLLATRPSSFLGQFYAAANWANSHISSAYNQL